MPPPVELGPCLVRTHPPKRASQASILSTASLRRHQSPGLSSDGTASEGRISVSPFDHLDVVDDLGRTSKMSDRSRTPNGDDVSAEMNGSDEVIESPSMDSGLDGSDLRASIDVTGGISREQFPNQGGDISTTHINIRLLHQSPTAEANTRRERLPGIVGGMNVGDGDRPPDALGHNEETTAEFDSDNLSVSLSQHSAEDNAPDLNVTDSQSVEVRPETIISPLRVSSPNSTRRDDSSQRGDSLLGDRTHDLHRSDLMTSGCLSEHTMEDTTQPPLSAHPIDSTAQGTMLSEYPMGLSGSESTRPVGASQTSQDLSEYPMESTTRTQEGTINELSQYPLDHTKASSLAQHSQREEPIGEQVLSADSNKNRSSADSDSIVSDHSRNSNRNRLGADSDSNASDHSRNASTVIRHVIGGVDTSHATTASDVQSRHSSSRASDRSIPAIGSDVSAHSSTRSTPSTRSSGSRPLSAASAAEKAVRKTTFSESFSRKDKSVDKPMESVRSKRTMADRQSGSSAPSESSTDTGATEKDSQSLQITSDKSRQSRQESLGKLPRDRDSLKSMARASGANEDTHTPKTKDSNVQQRDQCDTRRQNMGAGLKEQFFQKSFDSQDLSTSSTVSLSMGTASRPASSQEGFRIHGVGDSPDLSPKVSPEGVEASHEDSAPTRGRALSQASRASSQTSHVSSQSRNMPMLPPSAITSSQPGRAYLNLDDLKTQDALADKVAVLLGDAIVTTLSRDRPGVGDGGSSSDEAGTPDSIETEQSEKAMVSREQTPDAPHVPGFPHRDSTSRSQQEAALSSARSGGGTSIASYTDSLADRVAQILAESDAIRQIQAFQRGGSVSPTLSEVSTSSSVRQIIDKVLQKTAAGAGYISCDDASSVTSDIPSYPIGGIPFEYDVQQPMSPMRSGNLSKSMSVPMGSPYSPESARRTPSPRPYRDDHSPYSPRPQSGGYRSSVASYQTADTLDHKVQNLLKHTAYMDQPGMSPAYSPGRESPRSFYGRESPAPSPRIASFDRVRQGEVPPRRHSATGIPHPGTYPGEDIGAGGDQGFYLRMEPEGRSSLVKRSGQPGHSSQIPVASGVAGHMSPSIAQMYRKTPDRRTMDNVEPQSPRGHYTESPESIDSLSHRVREILAANLPRQRPPVLPHNQGVGDYPLPEGGLQAVWQAKVATGQTSRTSVQSTPYSSTHVSPRSSHQGTPRSGSPRGFAPPNEPLYMDTEQDEFGMPDYASAFERARNVLTSQLQRANEMTFNHSMDIRDPVAARFVGRNQQRRMSNGQDQYSSSPRQSPLLSPRMHPSAPFGSRHVREAWGEDYQSQEDLQQQQQQAGYYGSLPDDLSPALPEDSGHFYPLRPYSSPTKSFQPVPSSHDYHSLPRSFAKSPRHAAAQSVDSSRQFGPLERSVSTSAIDIAPPHSRIYPRQMSDFGDPQEMDAADIRYKTWEADVLTAKARMSPRPDRSTSIPVPVPGSPRGYRRAMSRESDLHRMSPDPRMSPRTTAGMPMYKPPTHGSLPAKLNSPLGRDAYGASNIKAYRPPGSAEMQYTYPLRMDEESISNQTMESSHPGKLNKNNIIFQKMQIYFL